MARGGRRRGRPGTAYGNRRDLNEMPVAAPTGLGYGERKAIEDAQRAVPVASPGVPPQAAPTSPPPATWPIPGTLTPLDAPSERPGEPVTAGLPIGPGAGPEALGEVDDPTIDELRAAYMLRPSEYLRELIELLDEDE